MKNEFNVNYSNPEPYFTISLEQIEGLKNGTLSKTPFKDREISVKALRDILAWGYDITGNISDIAERALKEMGEEI